MLSFFLLAVLFIVLRWAFLVPEAKSSGLGGPMITVGMSSDEWLDGMLELLDEREKQMEG